MAKVKLTDKGWNFLNTNGKRINDEWYYSVTNFSEDFAKVYKTEEDYYNDVYYYLGTDGQLYDCNKQPLQ